MGFTLSPDQAFFIMASTIVQEPSTILVLHTLSSSIQVMLYYETCRTFFKNMFGLQDMPYHLLKDQVEIQNTATLC